MPSENNNDPSQPDPSEDRPSPGQLSKIDARTSNDQGPTLFAATLDELFAEIKARSELVFAITRCNSPQGEGWTWSRHVKGPAFELAGFVEVEKQDMIKDFLKEMKRIG